MTHMSRWGTISQMDVSRVVLVPITSMATAVFSAAGPAGADPPPTQVITTVAVGPNGQPINGYQEAPTQGNVFEVSDCTTPSPSVRGVVVGIALLYIVFLLFALHTWVGLP